MITPRYYQNEAAGQTIKYLCQVSEGNGLILLPTGTGKSVVIALIAKLAIDMYFPTRILILTHVKELVEQNAKKMQQVCPSLPIGINCDGLGKRDTQQPVIFGSVGSVLPMVGLLGYRDIVIVDEAHGVSDDEDAQYAKIFIALKIVNPGLRIVGLTATGFDNKGPMIRYEEKTNRCISVFTDIIYNRTRTKDFQEFVDSGWLSPLINKNTHTKYNIKNVGISAGDYNLKALQNEVDKEELTRAAVGEIIHMMHVANRHCLLTFAAGIKHAEHVAEEMQNQGLRATFVHSKLSGAKRDDRIEGFKAGEYDAMVNNGILTTGFDHPPIDIMAILRHTISIKLWIQMLGRMTRPYDYQNPEQYIPGFEYTKQNGLVLDFAKNTSRLGPIDAPFVKKKWKKGEEGDAPMKICPEKEKNSDGEFGCGVYNYAGARECYLCERKFDFETKFSVEVEDAAPMTTSIPEPVWLDVSFVNYEKVITKSSPPMLRAVYYCNNESGKRITDVVCLEHTTKALGFAHNWWRERAKDAMIPIPPTVDDALKVTHLLKRPIRLLVQEHGTKYPSVKQYVYQ